MPDVNININGNANGANSALDSLREKAKSVGADINKISEGTLGNKTFTEQKVAVQQSIREISEAKKNSARADYASAREANNQDFSQAEADFKAGKISKKTFDEHKANFETSNKDLRTNESKEILAIEREMNNSLRTIIREMTQSRQIAREKQREDTNDKQRDDDEHQTPGRPDQAPHDQVAREVSRQRTESEDDDKDKGDSHTRDRLLSAGTAAANGNLQGTVTNGIAGGGSLLGMSKGGAAVAGIVAAIWGLLSAGDKISNAAGGVGAMRGLGINGAETMDFYRQRGNYDSRNGEEGILKTMGVEGSDFLDMMSKKAKETGRSGNLRERTMDDVAFQKGFGADVGVLNQFEKFTKNGETGVQVSMDMLNVLTSIEKSSLKEGNLVDLQNKINTQSSLFDIQRTKRDSIDADGSLRIMAAFESIGLSQKGDKAGNFLGSVIGGLGEGGGDNAMLMKYEMAKRTHPELANDLPSLRRFVKYHNDDPDYMLQALSGFGDWTKGNEMAQDDLINTIFNPGSETDYNMMKEAMGNNSQFKKLLGGKGLNKSPKQTLTKDAMYSDAAASTGTMTEAISGFKNIIGDAGSMFDNFLKGIMGNDGKSINVNTVQKPATTPVVNKVIAGKK